MDSDNQATNSPPIDTFFDKTAQKEELRRHSIEYKHHTMCAESGSSSQDPTLSVLDHIRSGSRSSDTSPVPENSTIGTSVADEISVHNAWTIQHYGPSDPLYQLRGEMGNMLVSPVAELPSGVQNSQKLYPIPQNAVNAVSVSVDIPGPSIASPDEVNLLHTLSKDVEVALQESHGTNVNHGKSHARKPVSRKSSQDFQVSKSQIAKHIKCLLNSASRTIAEAHALAEIFGIPTEGHEDWRNTTFREVRPPFGVKHNVSASNSGSQPKYQ